MPGVRDVRAEDFINAYSSHLKRSGAFTLGGSEQLVGWDVEAIQVESSVQ